MTAPNVNTLWGEVIIEELARQGVGAVCIAPGSRSTPLVMAAANHPDLEIFSHLDERSAAFFALGRAKRTGEPTPLICTSGTAAANFHPAVIEADAARAPMLILTADRPPELRDSGANQTIDQIQLYGDATRWYRTLPEPEAEPRKLRMLRTTVARAVSSSKRTPPGPVHLDVPFRKPLEPVETDEVSPEFERDHPRAAAGRDGPYVRAERGRQTLDEATVASVATAVSDAERGLIVVGPRPAWTEDRSIVDLADATGFPLLVDPLSGLRFGPGPKTAPRCGGYDGYLHPSVTVEWPDPDIVLRVGGSPTSAVLQEYLERVDARSFLVDAGGGWEEATFTATDLLQVDGDWLAAELAGRVSRGDQAWVDRFDQLETRYWELLESVELPAEGAIVDTVLDQIPDGGVVFASNSMPVRDLDRFGQPRDKPLTTIGNRGASGIDGITSTALGAGSEAEGDLVLLTGDLAFYHDMNGLLAIDRWDVEATIVLINNDGGGIFHMLPISEFDPPFTEHFKTPHGLDFSPTGSLYDLQYTRTLPADFAESIRETFEMDGSAIIEVPTDAEDNHRERAELADLVIEDCS